MKRSEQRMGVRGDSRSAKDALPSALIGVDSFRHMAEAIDQAYWLIDVATLDIVYSSPASRRIWGFDPIDNNSSPERTLRHVHPDDLPAFTDMFGAVLCEKREAEYRIVRPDGELRWLRTRVFPVTSDDGEVKLIAGVTDDVTARKQAQQEAAMRADFARLLADVATGFIALPESEIDAGLERALADIVRFADVDVGFVVLLGPDGDAFQEAHLWAVEDAAEHKRRLLTWRLSEFPWFRERLVSEPSVYMPDVNDMPENAASERGVKDSLGIRAALSVPLRSSRGLLGFLSLISFKRSLTWSEETIRLMHVACEAFAGVLERRRDARELARYAAFEKLVGKLAAEFVNLPAERLTEGIEAALRELTTFVGADRGGIFLADPDTGTQSLVYEWHGTAMAPPDDSLQGLPSPFDEAFLRKLRDERWAEMASPDDVPPELAAVKQSMTRNGIGSFVNVPLVRRGEMIGILGFASAEERHAWPADLPGLLAIATGIVVAAIDRAAVEEEIRRRAELERLVTELATEFINLPLADVDDGIVRALGALGQFGDVDRVGIFQFVGDDHSAVVTHDWQAPGAPPVDAVPREHRAGNLGPLFARLRDGEVINVASVAALPPESAELRAICEEYAVKSLVNVPLTAGGRVIGWLGLGAVRHEVVWSDHLVLLLRIAAEMFANALERMRTEESVRRHQAELAHALRVGTMSQLAAGLAHELNQPLSAILSYARGCEHRLAAGVVDAAELRPALGQISTQALRAGNVIRALREMVRKGAHTRTRCEVNTLIDDALRVVEPEMVRSDAQVTFVPGADLPLVHVDAAQIAQVVLNLVHNAVESFAAQPNDRPRIVQIATLSEGRDRVVIRVRDTGPGIAEDDYEKIFDDFYTTKPQGLGLGLSISRTLVRSHGGELIVEPSRDGAVFRVALPGVR